MSLYEVVAFMQSNGWGIDRIINSVIVTLLLGLLGLNWWLRDSVRDLIRDIHDRNGLRDRTDDHETRIKRLESRVIGEEAIAEHDRQMMQEVGRKPERLRDILTGETESQRDPHYRYKHKEK